MPLFCLFWMFWQVQDLLKETPQTNLVPPLSLNITSSQKPSQNIQLARSNLYWHIIFLSFLALVNIWKPFVLQLAFPETLNSVKAKALCVHRGGLSTGHKVQAAKSNSSYEGQVNKYRYLYMSTFKEHSWNYMQKKNLMTLNIFIIYKTLAVDIRIF